MNQCCFGYKEELFCHRCGTELSNPTSKTIPDLFPDLLGTMKNYWGGKNYVFTGEIVNKYVYTVRRDKSHLSVSEFTLCFVTLQDASGSTLDINVAYDKKDSLRFELGDVLSCTSKNNHVVDLEERKIDKHDKPNVKTKNLALATFKHHNSFSDLSTNDFDYPEHNAIGQGFPTLLGFLYGVLGSFLVGYLTYNTPLVLIVFFASLFIGVMHGYSIGRKREQKKFDKRLDKYSKLKDQLDSIKETPIKAFGIKLKRTEHDSDIVCTQCKSKNNKFSAYCSTCGKTIEHSTIPSSNRHNSKEDITLAIEPVSVEADSLFEESEVEQQVSLLPSTTEEIELSPIDRFNQEIADTALFRHQEVTDYLQKQVMASNIRCQLTTQSFFGQVKRRDDKVEVRKKTEQVNWTETYKDGSSRSGMSYRHHRNSEAFATITLELPNGDESRIDIPQSILNNINPGDWISLSVIRVGEAGKEVHCFYEDVYNYTTKKDAAPRELKFRKTMLRGRAVRLLNPIGLTLFSLLGYSFWINPLDPDFLSMYLMNISPFILALFLYTIIGGLACLPGNRKRFKEVNDGTYTFRRRLDELQPPLQQRLDDALEQK